ncbi:hypothetical protein V6N13_095161 [Hibiscus sabdariffa]
MEEAKENLSRVTLFVENIPSRMQWRGLWHMFARHGKVIRTFIAKKLSRGSKWFGFVEFGNEEDSNRAMERLNGFITYGFRLTVKAARQRNSKNSEEKKSPVNEQKRMHIRVEKEEDQQRAEDQKLKEISPRERYRKKVIGHVVEEELWKLQKCLVGVTTTVCSVKYIANRLEEWGLNGIRILRMGGKTFLLTFEDEDLYIMLEDLEWSYLKEIFYKIDVWSEKDRSPSRATWIEVRGLPLHVWNGPTLKRIAAIWGNFEAWGENFNRVFDAERTTILITTQQQGSIDELVEVEVGCDIHEVYVRELGFKDSTMDPLLQADKKKIPVDSQSGSSSESASFQEQSFSSGKEGNYAKKVPLMEQDFGMMAGESPEHSEGKSKGQVGEKDFNALVIEGKLSGCEVKIGAESDVAGAEGRIRSLDMGNNLRSWAEVLSGPTPKQPELLLGSNSGLGLLPKAVNQELIEETKVVDQPIGGTSSPVDKEQNLDLDFASDREMDSLDHFGEMDPVDVVSPGDSDLPTYRAFDDVRDMGLLRNMMATNVIST